MPICVIKKLMTREGLAVCEPVLNLENALYKQDANWNIGQRSLNSTFHIQSFIQEFV